MPKYVCASTAAEHISDCLKIPICELADVFADIQPADVVPVVRCKDCEHLMISGCYGECSIGHLGIVRPDDFCSYGERKDGDTT